MNCYARRSPRRGWSLGTDIFQRQRRSVVIAAVHPSPNRWRATSTRGVLPSGPLVRGMHLRKNFRARLHIADLRVGAEHRGGRSRLE